MLQARAESLPDACQREAVCEQSAEHLQAKNNPPTFLKTDGKIVASKYLARPREPGFPVTTLVLFFVLCFCLPFEVEARLR